MFRNSVHPQHFLQHYEDNLIKNILDSSNITYYNRYVDDILIIYDQNKTNNLRMDWGSKHM